MKTTPCVKSPSIVHDRGRGYSNRLILTLCRGCTLYPQDTTSVASTNRNKTVQKLYLNIDTPSVLTNRQTASHR